VPVGYSGKNGFNSRNRTGFGGYNSQAGGKMVRLGREWQYISSFANVFPMRVRLSITGTNGRSDAFQHQSASSNHSLMQVGSSRIFAEHKKMLKVRKNIKTKPSILKLRKMYRSLLSS
jgi:hypothetical protein